MEVSELKRGWRGMREFYSKKDNGYILGLAEKGAIRTGTNIEIKSDIIISPDISAGAI